MDIASFHLQSNKYDGRRPPAFGEHPQLTCLERERERLNEPTLDEVEERIDDIIAQQQEHTTATSTTISLRQRFKKSIMSMKKKKQQTTPSQQSELQNSQDAQSLPTTVPKEISKTTTITTSKADISDRRKATKAFASDPPSSRNLTRQQSKNIGFSNLLGNVFQRKTATTSPITMEKENMSTTADDGQPVMIKTVPSTELPQAWQDNEPPLLLQEGAHLLSLLSAVAFSTLRNDLEQADSPLITFTAGAPWPHVDPDAYGADVREGWSQSRTFRTVLSFLLGMSRNDAARTLYNAARPFRVIGGVSDAEIEVLQAARGPYAKVALCTMWLEEFITREHMNGGLGAVGAPIISRLFQFTSDGMIGYNQARKIAYIPFPFPHAQITSLFVLVVVILMPTLMITYINNRYYAFFINLVTVMCFTGLHEVARELENPFQNVPNDIPLNNFQAQFNESLMQMFAGFHPDAFWQIYPVDHDNHKGDNEDGGDDPASSYPPTKERVELLKRGKESYETVDGKIQLEALNDEITLVDEQESKDI